MFHQCTDRTAAQAASSAVVVTYCVLCMLAGCQQKMADQPSFKPLEPCNFFPDGRSARPPVPGTVPRGHWRGDIEFVTGRTAPAANIPPPDAQPPTPGAPPAKPRFAENTAFTTTFPIAVDEATVRYGHDRFTIYCAVCHDSLGTGRGKIVERGYTAPPSFHIDRLRTAPAGRIFAVITEGYGSMPAYGAELPPEDRWAIVAYVRALQLSQHFPADELTDDMRAALAAAQQNAADAATPSAQTGGPTP